MSYCIWSWISGWRFFLLKLDDLNPGNASKVLAVIGGDAPEIPILHVESVVGIDEIDVLVDVRVEGQVDPGTLVAHQVRGIQNLLHLLGDLLLLQFVERFESPNHFRNNE